MSNPVTNTQVTGSSLEYFERRQMSYCNCPQRVARKRTEDARRAGDDTAAQATARIHELEGFAADVLRDAF